MTRARVPAPLVARSGDVELSDGPKRLDFDAIHSFLAASYGSPGIPRATVQRAFAGSPDLGLYRVGAPLAHPERFMLVHRTDPYRGAGG